MTLWKSFGASVRGPSHITEGLPNQDAWMSFHHTWGDGIVVSDGVGSKPFSNFGSDAACLAVGCAALACRIKAEISQVEINRDYLFERIQHYWLSNISPLEPRDCSATCLFAFRFGDGLIHLGMLGDGLVAALKPDGSVVSLTEDKGYGFLTKTRRFGCCITPAQALRVAVCACWRNAPLSSPAFTTRGWSMVTFLPTMPLWAKVTPPMSG